MRQEVAELEGAAEQEVQGLDLGEVKDAACKYFLKNDDGVLGVWEG